MSAPTTDLSTIETKIRRITGRPSENQITTAQIDQYINTFYLYDLPEHIRTLPLKQTYSFNLDPNVDTYNFDFTNWYSVEKPVYVAGYELQFYSSPELFYRLYPQLQTIQTLTTGNGTPGPYSGTLTSVPFLSSTTNISGVLTPRVLVSSISATGAPLNANDDGNGGFIGDFSGSINYVSGAITVTANTSVGSGQKIQVQTTPYVASRPNQMLFFNSQFQFRPVPDQGYTVSMTAYRKPTALLNSTESPLLPEWWQVLALGAALKIFEDNGDDNQYKQYYPIFIKYLDLIERRTLQQIKINKATTIFTLDDVSNFGNAFPQS